MPKPADYIQNVLEDRVNCTVSCSARRDSKWIFHRNYVPPMRRLIECTTPVWCGRMKIHCTGFLTELPLFNRAELSFHGNCNKMHESVLAKVRRIVHYFLHFLLTDENFHVIEVNFQGKRGTNLPSSSVSGENNVFRNSGVYWTGEPLVIFGLPNLIYYKDHHRWFGCLVPKRMLGFYRSIAR